MKTKQQTLIDEAGFRKVLIDDDDPLLHRVLVIDGDPFVRMNCRRILNGSECVVFTAENEVEATAKLSREEYDLIVTDIMLPDVYGGIAFAKKAMKIQPWSDLVIMADKPSIWDAWGSVKLGAYKYIEKSFVFDFITHIADKAFDKNGWIMRKSHIDMHRHHIDTSKDGDYPIYYKNGSWARHRDENIWEVGCDINHLPSGDQMPCHIKLFGEQAVLEAGKPYARIFGRTDPAYSLAAPMTGTILDVNEEVLKEKFTLSAMRPYSEWPLWLTTIQVKKGD